MAKQEQRTARKDYPDAGIRKGDTYYFAQIKTGQRSSKTIRSLKPIPQSQLTTSPFKSSWYGVQEAWEESGKDGEAMREAATAIRELGEEAQSGFDNMPEGLQQGETGQMLENRANESERIATELEELADRFDELEEPDEVEQPEEGDDGMVDTVAQGLWEEYEAALEEYESDKEGIIDEADGLIGEMPE